MERWHITCINRNTQLGLPRQDLKENNLPLRRILFVTMTFWGILGSQKGMKDVTVNPYPSGIIGHAKDCPGVTKETKK